MGGCVGGWVRGCVDGWVSGGNRAGDGKRMSGWVRLLVHEMRWVHEMG